MSKRRRAALRVPSTRRAPAPGGHRLTPVRPAPGQAGTNPTVTIEKARVMYTQLSYQSSTYYQQQRQQEAERYRLAAVARAARHQAGRPSWRARLGLAWAGGPARSEAAAPALAPGTGSGYGRRP